MADIHIHVSYRRGKATVSDGSVPGANWMHKNLVMEGRVCVIDAELVNEFVKEIEANGLTVEVI